MAATTMTSQERIRRMFEHREADRVPITDSPWEGTLLRWRNEGMPAGVDWQDYFDVDKFAVISVDNSPRFPVQTLEETEQFRVTTTPWGVTLKNFKVADSTPEFLGYRINSRETWEEAKARMTVSRDRVDWAYLEREYPKWRKEGRWTQALFWFGFDVAHSWMSGFETILIAMMEDPEWFKDIVSTMLDSSIALFEMVWDAGYKFDSIFFYDDMGYKGRTFFSNELYADLLMPYHKKAIDWAHDRGVKAHLHSCGNVMARVPQLVDIGLDALNPIEIKAGMDIKALKRDYGNKLVLHGGVNALIMDKPELVLPYIEDMVPVVKQDGGFIFSSDHSIPNAVSLETYRQVVDAVKRCGAY